MELAVQARPSWLARARGVGPCRRWWGLQPERAYEAHTCLRATQLAYARVRYEWRRILPVHAQAAAEDGALGVVWSWASCGLSWNDQAERNQKDADAPGYVGEAEWPGASCHGVETLAAEGSCCEEVRL